MIVPEHPTHTSLLVERSDEANEALVRARSFVRIRMYDLAKIAHLAHFFFFLIWVKNVQIVFCHTLEKPFKILFFFNTSSVGFG